MKRVVFLALPAMVAATPAFAGSTPQLPGPGILGLVAAAVVGGIFLARRKR